MTRRRNRRSEAEQIVDRLRAAHAYSFFYNLVTTAKQQISIVAWQKFGGLEAEEVLHAWQAGQPNPFFEDYAVRKATAGHPGPSLSVQHFQRLAVVLSATLQQAGLTKTKARALTAKTMTGAGLLGQPTGKVIERLELSQPPLSEQDQDAIRAALARCGADPSTLCRHFLGAVRQPWFAAGETRFRVWGASYAESQHARIPAMNEIQLHTQLPQAAGRPVPAFFGRQFLTAREVIATGLIGNMVTLRRLMAEGRFPRPLLVGRKLRVWDVLELQALLDRLAREREERGI